MQAIANLLKSMARPEGFEPPTLCFEGRCSIQLSYGRVPFLLYLNFRRERQLLQFHQWEPSSNIQKTLAALLCVLGILIALLGNFGGTLFQGSAGEKLRQKIGIVFASG
jgi:hypothetical protein